MKTTELKNFLQAKKERKDENYDYKKIVGELRNVLDFFAASINHKSNYKINHRKDKMLYFDLIECYFCDVFKMDYAMNFCYLLALNDKGVNEKTNFNGIAAGFLKPSFDKYDDFCIILEKGKIDVKDVFENE